MKITNKISEKLSLFKEKVTNIYIYIYIYIYGFAKTIQEGRLFTNKEQSLFKNGRRLLLTNNFLFDRVVIV